MSTDLTVPQSAEVAALIASQEDEFEGISFQTPILKVCQALTREVQDDKAEAGDFLNTLTSESLGDRIEFIVSYFSRGRSASRPEDEPVLRHGRLRRHPGRWADLVGEDTSAPRSRVRRGRGATKSASTPRRSRGARVRSSARPTTTRASSSSTRWRVRKASRTSSRSSCPLQRSNKAASDKILTLKRSVLRGKPFWANVFELSTRRRDFDRGTSYVVDAKLGRPTDAGEQAQATELALALGGGRVIDNGSRRSRPLRRSSPTPRAVPPSALPQLEGWMRAD